MDGNIDVDIKVNVVSHLAKKIDGIDGDIHRVELLLNLGEYGKTTNVIIEEFKGITVSIPIQMPRDFKRDENGDLYIEDWE